MTNYQLPVASWVEQFTAWLTTTFAGLFDFLQHFGQQLMDNITSLLIAIPPLVFIVVLTIGAFLISNKKIGLSLFTLLGLLFIYNQNLWTDLMSTVTLVLLSSLLSIIIGVPLGILMAKSQKAQSIFTPILDLMQTMPGFVYLIPAVAFFGIGIVPGVFASVIFALPPTVRFTNLGIRQVPKELVEAADSYGSTGWQKLFKLELPLAKNTILAGVNQTTMLALSMVVIASMIGAPGLGRGVLSALQRAQVGNGFVNGIALVILAIIIDRFTQHINKKKTKPATAGAKKKRWPLVTAVVVVITALFGSAFFSNHSKNKTISLGYVEWDSEVASSHVLGEVLKDMDYHVNLAPLDNAIMWESLAKGETDAIVSAWLPRTHAEQYQQYKNQVDDLGPNLTGAKLGLVVPSYIKVDSIDQLSQQAGQKIFGIEPGAGVVTAAEKTQKAYPNLKDWTITTSSSGAMTVALSQAIKNKDDIVITGWAPHWMFAKYDLKYLNDPKGTMGNEETIHTMTRMGLKKDDSKAYQVLKNFHWSKEDMESVVLAINQGTAPQQAARQWIDAHQEQVAEWKK